jgi:hypothetical protein
MANRRLVQYWQQGNPEVAGRLRCLSHQRSQIPPGGGFGPGETSTSKLRLDPPERLVCQLDQPLETTGNCKKKEKEE